MRANVADYEWVDGLSFDGVLRRLADDPGKWTPIAGGTELMVQLGAGNLRRRHLIDIWRTPELGGIVESPEFVRIGAGVTFTELRRSPLVNREFPLLSLAASWIGGIANQNRATIGGNIVNGSPAADAPPALLVYDADVELTSIRGVRRVAYCDFHTGYKKTALAADELLQAVCLPRRSGDSSAYLRKVGTREAQAISKVAVAGVYKVEHGRVKDMRLACASVADRPYRCVGVERLLEGLPLAGSVSTALTALEEEILPLDDIRSTSGYRLQVAKNLVAEFLRKGGAS